MGTCCCGEDHTKAAPINALVLPDKVLRFLRDLRVNLQFYRAEFLDTEHGSTTFGCRLDGFYISISQNKDEAGRLVFNTIPDFSPAAYYAGFAYHFPQAAESHAIGAEANKKLREESAAKYGQNRVTHLNDDMPQCLLTVRIKDGGEAYEYKYMVYRPDGKGFDHHSLELYNDHYGWQTDAQGQRIFRRELSSHV